MPTSVACSNNPYDTAFPRSQRTPRHSPTSPTSCTSHLQTLDNIVELFQDRPQAIFYGSPGTGKTYIARTANHLTSRGGATKLSSSTSYAYEDFVEGWRPTPPDSSSFVTALQTFADDAAKTLTTGTSWRSTKSTEQTCPKCSANCSSSLNTGTRPPISNTPTLLFSQRTCGSSAL